MTDMTDEEVAQAMKQARAAASWPGDAPIGNVARLALHLNRRVKELDPGKMAPVQGYSAGIPWAMHLRAYDAYCKRYGEQPALIKGGCRGGFGTLELDSFIPGWREELSELAKLKRSVERAEARLAKAHAAIRAAIKMGRLAGPSYVGTWKILEDEISELDDAMKGEP